MSRGAGLPRATAKLARRAAGLVRGPAGLLRGVARLARGPAGLARGAAGLVRGPAGLARGPARRLRGPFSAVAASQNEIAAPRAGDELVPHANVVMNRAFTVDAAPAEVWPWLLQLGKRRAGWYLPASIERFLPPKRRAARAIQPAWQRLRVGDVIPDYGRDETFTVAILAAPTTLVYRSRRGKLDLSWSITLHPQPASDRTRLHLRLRLGIVRHRWLAETGGDLLDALTILGLAAGLRERLRG